jgi:hypothetical protein
VHSKEYDMPKPGKQPQDRKQKGAVDALRAEAANIPQFKEVAGSRVRVTGRSGTVTVTILDILDWLGEASGLAREGDYLGAYCGMVSDEDAARLRAVRPTVGSLMAAEVVTDDDEETGEPTVGESQAS